MDLKKFYFGDLVDYGNHKSTYFDLPAKAVVVIAYLLPGILSMVYSGFSYFATLILIAIGAFEKKSKMVKEYCYQFCFVSMVFNIVLSLLYMIGQFVPIVQLINAMLSIVVTPIIIVVFIYSIVRALQNKLWRIPWVADFIEKKFLW